jgi:uncharacterized membrane protein
MSYEGELAEEYNLRITIAQATLYSSIGLAVLIFIFAIYVYIKFDKEYTAEFTGDYLRELPNDDSPAAVSYLYYMEKINEETITATLLDLIRRDYISLDSKGSNDSGSLSDFKLIINRSMPLDDLEAHEKHFMVWMFDKIGDGKTVTTRQIKEYGKKNIESARAFQSNLKTFVRMAEKLGRSKRYFINGPRLNKTALMLINLIPVLYMIVLFTLFIIYYINILPSIIICIITMIIYSTYILNIKKRTKEGNELFVKWKAFKKFLEHFSNMEDYPIPSIIVWEHYLVYATVLKISDKVMEQLKIKLPESEFESSNATYMRTAYGRHGFYHSNLTDHFRSSFVIAKMNASSTIVQASNNRSSFGGRGGGFGGGSSFGGGGGGGRSR